MEKLVCAVVAGLLLVQGCLGYYKSASVYCTKEKCTAKSDVLDTEATAFGVYNDTMETTGWGILNISAGLGTKPSNNNDIMYAAGYLEGMLTQERLYENYVNLDSFFSNKMDNKTELMRAMKDFFFKQDMFMRQMIRLHANSDPYWRHMGYILAQYDGLVQGYEAVAPSNQKLTAYAFQMLNGNGDMYDLIPALSPRTMPDWRTMTKEQLQAYIMSNDHCSVLIKLLGGYEDIYMSHSSWGPYQAMLRMFKHYNLNVDDPATAAKRISFASYPGLLNSWDDFYLLGSGLVQLQTTNSVFNHSLYDAVTPQSLLSWHRVRLAHMMSSNGRMWGPIFEKYNSGTYNNQYMLIDLSKIHLGQHIDDDALWVVEQIPGVVEYADTSDVLRTGYWPSYNIPFFEKIYNMSGYPEVVAKHGPDFSYQLAPRAKIFRRDQGKVTDMDTMKKLMRYNDYKEDPYSEDDACNTICCRGDLMKDPMLLGCYDTKISTYKMAQAFTATLLNGPTLGTGLAPFRWTDADPSHEGMPDMYNFDFITTKPLPSP